MEKTTVSFVWIASCIHHFFFFFLSGSASGDVRCRSHLTLGSLFHTSRDLLSLAVSFNCYLFSQDWAVRFKHLRVGRNPSWGWAIVSPQAAAQRGVVCLSKMVAAKGGWLSTRILAVVLSVLSPRLQCPVSPVHSANPFARDLLSLVLSLDC